MLRPLVARVLESYGYTVLAAADGTEALARRRAEHGGAIDLLLTDVVMPRHERPRARRAAAARAARVKVLFTSGYPADTSIRHGIAEARVAFIQKPYLADELAREIRTLLDRQPV